MPRMSVGFDEETWKRLRALAEAERDHTGRASVSSVIRALVARRLAERSAATAGAD